MNFICKIYKRTVNELQTHTHTRIRFMKNETLRCQNTVTNISEVRLNEI